MRGFVAADRGAVRDLFDRAGADSPVESLWGDRDSEAAVYLDPYIDLEPESLFVAEQAGALVGYLTGCVDSSRFPGEDARLEAVIREHALLRRPRAMRFFVRSLRDLLIARLRPTGESRDDVAAGVDDPRWPAHLHIAVLDRARGTGAADELMRCWLDRLRELGSPGCHLQTQVENVRAVRFFERAGFVRYGPTPPIPGVRYRGRRLHMQTMVQSLSAGA